MWILLGYDARCTEDQSVRFTNGGPCLCRGNSELTVYGLLSLRGHRWRWFDANRALLDISELFAVSSVRVTQYTLAWVSQCLSLGLMCFSRVQYFVVVLLFHLLFYFRAVSSLSAHLKWPRWFCTEFHQSSILIVHPNKPACIHGTWFVSGPLENKAILFHNNDLRSQWLSGYHNELDWKRVPATSVYVT